MNLSASAVYSPPSESAGGWRWCKDKDQILSLAGMDPERLSVIRDAQLQIYQGPWAIAFGLLMDEYRSAPRANRRGMSEWQETAE